MQLRLLGPVEVVVDGRSCAVAGAGERAVLALLLLSAGRVVAADTLVDALWGSGLPRNPANALQVRVSKLRRVLAGAGSGEVAVRARPPGYVLEVDPERVDAHRFVRLVGEGRSARRVDPERAVALYRAALELWSGPAIAEFAGESWAQPDAVRLEGLRDAATEELFDLLVAGDVTAGLVGEIEAAVARRPRHERLYGQLMIALYRGGRQADALAVYRRAREMLRAELGLDPSVELRGIEQRILRQDPDVGGPQTPNPPAGPTPSPPRRLPVRLSSFVGRAADSARLADLVSRHRLVTVTGPGGVGKTSMAIEFARGTAAGEVWLVRLAGVADGELVARAVADALGVRDDPGAPAEVRLVAHLRDRSGLLLLDNCEHVVDACAVLAEQLLSSCPRLRLLATSREPLAVGGEVQYALAPLPAPDVDVAAEEVADFAAAQLFLERARSVLPGFAPDAASMLRLADICRRLDGIPLAIELAAAGVKALPVEDIAERLGTTFPALAGGPRTAEGRHRTLRAAVDWSHRLLTEPEQVLFRRLSVFRGGWDLRAAEQVASGGALGRDEVLEVLTRLVDRSLVVADHGEGPRFHYLETLRQFAVERLAESGETERCAAAHAAHFTELAQQGSTEVRGPDQRKWLRWLEVERDNLQTALVRLQEHVVDEPDGGLRLVAGLGWFWYFGSRPDGGRQVRSMLAAAAGGSDEARAHALLAASVAGRPAACIVHPNTLCAAAARESLHLLTAVGDDHAAAIATTLLAVEGIGGQDIPGSLQMLTGAEAQLRRSGDDWGQALVHFVRMELHFAAGATAPATACGRRALSIYRRLADHWGVSAVQLHLAVALHRTGELHAAFEAYEGALIEGRQVGVANTVQYALAGLGNLALQQGDPGRAERWFAEAHQVARTLGAQGNPLAALGQAAARRHAGDLHAARDLYARAQHLLAGQDKPDWAATALSGLGHIAELTGDLDSAEFCHRRAWQTARGPAASGAAAAAIEGLACVAAARGSGETAARLLGAAARWRASRCRPASGLETPDIDRATRAARELLGPTRFQAARRAATADPGDILADLGHTETT